MDPWIELVRAEVEAITGLKDQVAELRRDLADSTDRMTVAFNETTSTVAGRLRKIEDVMGRLVDAEQIRAQAEAEAAEAKVAETEKLKTASERKWVLTQQLVSLIKVALNAPWFYFLVYGLYQGVGYLFDVPLTVGVPQ